ncbi:sigma-70 family RNA polymerase sigma factor [Acaryochloris sp. IP29b_bin.137]|uniref:sigma-70 family RNA polymerase sigma factor n=1 Tax=Acaryochloris sp. IP29b_bin.137 TaxID=2969217 RepID=UPI00263429D8|nr:sigma-70 family RNA polymerase sigma factor [Acaryochloris sp. IP29b_bin.137]
MNITDRDLPSIDAEILPLLTEACKYPPGNFKRKQCLTKMIRIIQQSNRLWHEHTPYYEDALQQTWLYFCQNICEAGTGEKYDPSRSSVITWLNRYLKWRLQDFRIKNSQHLAKYYSSASQKSSHKPHDTLANVAAPPDIPPILETTQHWIETDPSGDLRKQHIHNRPEVNCQMLLLKRLFSQTQWAQISSEFDLPVSTLSSFYQRQCIPTLRSFGELNGFF